MDLELEELALRDQFEAEFGRRLGDIAACVQDFYDGRFDLLAAHQ